MTLPEDVSRETRRESARNLTDSLGFPLEEKQLDALETLAGWLASEGVAAGALGPSEAEHLWSRHILDSLGFAQAWQEGTPPSRLIDVGSGAGLPAVPLAIIWPETEILAVDRSGRRAHLVRRVVRILGLPNVVSRELDVRRLRDQAEGVTFRASLQGEDLVASAARLLDRGAPRPAAVVAWTRRGERDTTRIEREAETHGLMVSTTGLDDGAAFLIMRPRDD